MTEGKPDHLLSPENAALVLIDYQPEQVGTVRSIDHDLMMLNVTAAARAAAAYDLPVVLSTVGVELGVNTGTIEARHAELPDVQEIDRTTLNSWEDPEFRAAVGTASRVRTVILRRTSPISTIPSSTAVKAAAGSSAQRHVPGLPRLST